MRAVLCLNVIHLLENKPYPDRKNILFHPLHKSSHCKFYAFTAFQRIGFKRYVVKDTSFTCEVVKDTGYFSTESILYNFAT